jgi:hypothetical protein
VRISKDSVDTFLMVSVKILKLAAPRGCRCARRGGRLAGVGDLGLQEVVEAVVDLGDDGVEHVAALDHRQLAPGALEGGLGGGDGGVDFRLAGFMHHADQGIVDRVALLVRLAADVGYVLAVDEIQDVFHVVLSPYGVAAPAGDGLCLVS